MPRNVTAPSTDAHVVDEDEEMTAHEVAEVLGLKPSQLRKEKREAKRKEEFWSDPCWAEPF